MENLDCCSNVDFRVLYKSVYPTLFKIAYRITCDEEAAEDLSHDSLIKAHEKRMKFPTLLDAKYWLIRVTKNNALNYIKRKSRERNAYGKVLYENVRKRVQTSETQYLQNESIETVRRALDELPPKLKEAIVLKEYGELNYKEIGTILGISEGNVKVRIFRARKEIAKLIGGGDNVYIPD